VSGIKTSGAASRSVALLISTLILHERVRGRRIAMTNMPLAVI
jgi:hypothetical protein